MCKNYPHHFAYNSDFQDDKIPKTKKQMIVVMALEIQKMNCIFTGIKFFFLWIIHSKPKANTNT
jgi:hypothetical protein